MKVTVSIIYIILLSWITLISLDESQIKPYELDIPQGFPVPNIPANNQLTAERIALGKLLFYDPVLSIDSTVSCSSCHNPSLAFADDKAISPGVKERLGNRNAPTLTNVAYNPTFLFDGNLKTLEMQILVPIQEHAELNSNIVNIAEKLKNDSLYTAMSLLAYNRAPDPFVITRSISAFERTLISGNSRFDQHVFQKKRTLSKSEKRGYKLFSKKLYCTECHGGFNFTSFLPANNGLYEMYSDSGRMRVTHDEADRALFKIPTLRNIEVTAPYMHDGSISTLEEVVDHYAIGGKDHKNKSPIIQPFEISAEEKKDLINFLKSLTDEEFLTNPAFRIVD